MSWERARFVPWSRIPHGDHHRLEEDKERIFRQLQREANEAAAAAAAAANSTTASADAAPTTPRLQENKTWTKLPYSSGDLIKHTLFGGCVGSITGAVFGFVDSMRSAGESTSIMKRASDAQKLKYVLQGASRSASVFGLFFGGFHIVKYGIHIVADPGQFVEVGAAAVISMGTLLTRPNLRSSVPYGVMLIAMDSVHILMKSGYF